VESNLFKMEDMIGKVFRHKRLFNYVISPIKIEDKFIICLAGLDIKQEIPIDYFKRDWKIDLNIELDDMVKRMEGFPEDTPFTVAFNEFYEEDDGLEHSYLYFEIDEESDNFPVWKISRCTKFIRDNTINPFTMIMPIKDGVDKELEIEVNLMNEIRKENEFIEFGDFQGFEFGLLKLLEKKYLREI